MKYALDTNILLRLRQPEHEHHSACVAAIQTLKSQNYELCILPQNLYEFWVVATRPVENNGLGLDITQAEQELKLLKQLFSLYLDHPDIYEKWEKLIIDYQIKGKRAHDVKIIATMLTHNIQNLLTINIKDFQKFPEIQVINPLSSSPL